MSDGNEIKTRLSFETDTQGLQKAKSAYRGLADDLDEMVKAQEKAEKRQRAITQRMKEDLAFEQSVRKQSYNEPKSGANVGSGGAGNSGLNKVESGISAISALNDGLNVDNILNASSGILDLGAGIKSLPSAFTGLLSMLNPVTIGIGAIVGAFALFSAQTQKEAETLRATLNARKATDELIAGGATSADLQAKIANLKRLQDAEKERNADYIKAYEGIENLDPLSKTFAKAFDQREEEFSTELNNGAKAIEDYEIQINSLENAMGDAQLAANDLAQAILQQSELTKQAVLTEFEANERTGEQNRERLRQIDVQIEATNAQLEVLKGAESQSAETITKIAELEAQLKALGQEADITARFTKETSKDVQNSQKEREQSAKKLAEDETRLAEESARKQKESLEQQAEALRQYNEKIVDLATKNAQAEEDIARSLSDNRSDISRKLAQDLKELDKQARSDTTKAIIQAQADEAKSAREHQRTLEKIQIDAQRQREDLSANLDFAGLFNLEKDVNNQLSDAQSAFEAERGERQIANDANLADLKLSLSEARQSRQTAYKDELSEARIQYDRQRRDRAIAYDRELSETRIAYDRQYALLNEKFKRENSLYEGAKGASMTGSKAGIGGATVGNSANRGTVGGGSIGFAPTANIGYAPSQSINSSSTNNTRYGGSVVNRAGDRITNIPAVNITVNESFDVNKTARVVRDEMRYLLGINP